MLENDGSPDYTIRFLKNQGAGKIRFISVISAREGVKRITDHHPDVPIITAAVDEKLNSDAFIVPGLGDAGDRYFGTTGGFRHCSAASMAPGPRSDERWRAHD